jgi:hypothetical protein
LGTGGLVPAFRVMKQQQTQCSALAPAIRPASNADEDAVTPGFQGSQSEGCRTPPRRDNG